MSRKRITATANNSSQKTSLGSTTQLQLLGKDYRCDIFSDSIQLSGLHPSAAIETYYEDEEEQSYAEFVEIGKRNPNFKDIFHGQPVRIVINLLEKYFGMDVVYKEYKDSLDSKRLELTINELIYDLRALRTNRKRKNNRNNDPKVIDVFSLFDALTDSAIELYITIIALVDIQIGELIDEEDKNGVAQIVMGRACGDRVCCISLKECLTLECLLSVMIHECLHTLGFDHCNSWKCVMNAIVGDEQTIFLLPVNLRNFKLLHKIPDDDLHFLLNRYEEINDALKLFNGDIFKNDLILIKDKISLMKIEIN